jgi:hypothetical protein
MLTFLSLDNAHAAQVTASWDANTEPSLAGYKIYYGTQSRAYSCSIDVGNQTSYIITGLAAGTTYYFTGTAYDKNGNENEYCDEVIYTIPGTGTTTIPAITTTTSISGGGGSGGGGGVITTSTTTTAKIPSTTSTVPGNPADNQPPVALSGEDKTILLDTTISLDGRGSYDPDRDALQYQWKVASGPAQYILKNAATAMPSFKALAIGTYTIGLVVCDGLHYSAEDFVTITVKYQDDPGNGSGGNAAPVARAGDDQTAQLGEVVILDGSKSYDANNDALKYSWVQVTGPAVTLDNADTAAPSFVALAEGSYAFQLVVSDGLLESAPDIVSVTVEQSIAGDILLIAPENMKPITNQPMLTWQAEGFDIFKVQISKDGKRFITIGFTSEQSFAMPPFIAGLIVSGQITPVYWRVAGKQPELNSWVVSEMWMFLLINDNYENRGDKIKEAIEKLFWFIRIILKPAHDIK